MGIVGFDEIDSFGIAHSAVESFCRAERIPHAGDIEKVFCRTANQRRFRCSHHQVVCMVHAECQLAEDILLCVLTAYCVEYPVEACDVAAWGSDFYAVVQCH